MSSRLFLLLAGVLVCAGCSQSVPSSPSSGESRSAPSATPAVAAAAPTDPAAPVATLLGKPVYRRDFAGDANPTAADARFHSLVLGALMDDFCRREVIALSQVEIDAFWETLLAAAAAARGLEQGAPERAFDEAKIQNQLDETRAKLANPDAPWLERLQLEGLQRSLEFALQHKTVAAHEAYNHLMPLRCQKALYEKYGGKVVGMQISIEPVGAYQKLVEDAEASGQLTIHDATLEQSFRKRMNDDASRQEVPPEYVDFSLPAWLQISLRRTAGGGASPAVPPAATPPPSGNATGEPRS